MRQPAASIVEPRHASKKPRALAPVEESDAGGPGSLEPVSAITPDVIARQRALVAQARPLYEARRGLWVQAQTAAHVRYLDTAWLRRLRRQHLTEPR